MNWLLDTSSFLTRSHCGPGWTTEIVTLYQISNFLIFLSYVTISLAIYFLYVKKKKDLPSPHIFILFIFFIILCGLTHLSDVVVFYWAPYRLFTALTVLTAVASAITAYNLPLAVRSLVKLPSCEYVHRINNRLQEEVLHRDMSAKELTARNERLKARVTALEELLKANTEMTLQDLLHTNKWIHERNVAMQELNKMVSELESI